MNGFVYKLRNHNAHDDQPPFCVPGSEYCGPDCPGFELPDDLLRCTQCGSVFDIAEIVTALYSLLVEKMDETTERPFGEVELIDAIETYATAVAYSDQLLVWVPLANLNDFLHPLLDEALDSNDVHVVLDGSTAMFDLTEICEVYGLDMGLVYLDSDI